MRVNWGWGRWGVTEGMRTGAVIGERWYSHTFDCTEGETGDEEVGDLGTTATGTSLMMRVLGNEAELKTSRKLTGKGRHVARRSRDAVLTQATYMLAVMFI